MSNITENPVLAGLVAAFNTDENKKIANESKTLIAIISPEQVKGSSYSYFYGRDDNDEETTELLEKYEKLEAAIAAVKSALDGKRAGASVDSDLTPEQAKARLAEMQDELKAFNTTRRQIIKTAEMLGTSDEDIAELKEVLVSAGKTKRGGGTGSARVRWNELTVNGEDVKNFTEAAKRIAGTASADLTAAMLKAYGTSEWTTIRDNDPNVKFVVTDKDGKEFTIEGVLAEAKEAPNTGASDSDEDNVDDDSVEPTDADLEAIEGDDDDDDYGDD